MPTATDDLPLRWSTPAPWVQQATADLPAFLCDHAHLERKAASNALDLLGRWPKPVDLRTGCPADARAADRWCHVLTSIAQDELRHLAEVLRRLEAAGGHLTRHHINPYAAALRARVRAGQGRQELLDRLLVSSLIELRSCERFVLLAAGAPAASLRGFYASLVKSERGHYRAFLDLADLLPQPPESWEVRWDWWLDAEAEIARTTPPGPQMHSGVAPV